MSNAEQERGAPTRRRRWVKYGLNVGVLILATLVLVVLANWIGYRHYERFDFTRTRRYSLSPRTTRVLRGLDTNLRITTLYAANSARPELLRRVGDLLDEYERRSARVEVQRIDPTTQIERRRTFLDHLAQRYQKTIRENRTALGEADQLLSDVAAFADQQAKQLPGLVSRMASVEDAEAPMLMQQLNQVFLRLGKVIADERERVKGFLDEDLPDLQSARTLVSQRLSTLSENILAPAVERFNALIDAEATPSGVEDALLGMTRSYQRIRDRIERMRGRLEKLGQNEYTDLRARIGQSNSIVIERRRPEEAGGDPQEQAAQEQAASGTGVAVLTLDEIYPNLQNARLARLTGGSAQPEQGYRGEEELTGAILRLTLNHNTRVVFVNPTPVPVLSPPQSSRQAQRTMSDVAERLRGMNFQVSEWQPAGRRGRGGRVMPPEPRPAAKRGETMVFIVLPPPPPNPRQPGNPAGPITASALREHLRAGQPALVFASPSPGLAASGPDARKKPVLDALSGFGLSVDSERIILTSLPAPNGGTQPSNRIELTDWPRNHPVARAVRGLGGVLFLGLPIEMTPQAPSGVRRWPLARTPADTWAEEGYFQQRDRAQPDESDPKGPFTVAAAAEKGGTRLVLVSDQLWASDLAVRLGSLYQRYPANPELFVNSVYWLAGLDRLIAPGARTHDIRRIHAVGGSAMLAVRWIVLLGLPALCLLAGGAVWFVRRR